jgi:hypothetical protein
VQGGELENECRVLAQSYYSLKKVKCLKICVFFVCDLNLFLFMEIFLDVKPKRPFSWMSWSCTWNFVKSRAALHAVSHCMVEHGICLLNGQYIINCLADWDH